MSNLLQNNYTSYSNKQYGEKTLNAQEQENIISQLKSQVFDLQQNEKNYNALQLKYNALMNDSNIINEEKLRLEYELKQKIEASNKILSELQSDNENLQNELNAKQATNRILFNDNNQLFTNLESKTNEVEILKATLGEREAKIEKINEEKRQFQRDIASLTEIKGKNETSLQKLDNELVQLGKICDDQEAQMNELISNKKSLNEKLDSLTLENKNLLNTLKETNNQLQITKNQFENSDKSFKKQNDQLNDIEKNINRTKSELSSANNALIKEKGIKEELERKSERLDNMLKDKVNENKKLNNEIENIKSTLDTTSQERNKALSDIEKYTNHIKFLTQTNEQLIKELEGVLDRNNKIKHQLNRNERITSVLSNNRNDLESALNYLEKKISIPQSSVH